MLQIFNIGDDFHPKDVNGRLVKTSMYENLYGAYSYEFKVKRGTVLIVAIDGKLQEVTYDYRAYFPWSRRFTNKRLLQSYAQDGVWRQVISDEFGKMFKSENDIYYAMWCKKTRTMSFGTMFFHEQKSPL